MYIQVPTGPTSTRFAEPFESTLGQTTTGSLCATVSRETVCRLLSICSITYDPARSPTSAPYYQRADFVDSPAMLERDAPSNLVGRRKIDSCLVGTMKSNPLDPNGSGVVLAFRGTLPPGSPTSGFLDVISDWLNDFEAPLVPFKGPFAAYTPGIVAHKGFADSIQNLLDPSATMTSGKTVVNEIKTRLPAAGGRLYITGHSKGAALTYLAAFLLHRMGVRPCAVISFEAPRCSDQNFATQFDSMGIYSERYEFLNDIVPHVPPAKALGQMLTTALSFDPAAQKLLSLFYPKAIQSFSYVPVGKLHYVDAGNQIIIGDSTQLDLKRLARLVAMVAGAAKDGVVAAAKTPIPPGTQPLVALSVYFAKLLLTLKNMHAIDCKSGLMQALCKPVVSPCP